MLSIFSEINRVFYVHACVPTHSVLAAPGRSQLSSSASSAAAEASADGAEPACSTAKTAASQASQLRDNSAWRRAVTASASTSSAGITTTARHEPFTVKIRAILVRIQRLSKFVVDVDVGPQGCSPETLRSRHRRQKGVWSSAISLGMNLWKQ